MPDLDLGTAARLGMLLEEEPEFRVPWLAPDGSVTMRLVTELLDEADAEIAAAAKVEANYLRGR